MAGGSIPLCMAPTDGAPTENLMRTAIRTAAAFLLIALTPLSGCALDEVAEGEGQPSEGTGGRIIELDDA